MFKVESSKTGLISRRVKWLVLDKLASSQQINNKPVKAMKIKSVDLQNIFLRFFMIKALNKLF